MLKRWKRVEKRQNLTYSFNDMKSLVASILRVRVHFKLIIGRYHIDTLKNPHGHTISYQQQHKGADESVMQ